MTQLIPQQPGTRNLSPKSSTISNRWSLPSKYTEPLHSTSRSSLLPSQVLTEMLLYYNILSRLLQHQQYESKRLSDFKEEFRSEYPRKCNKVSTKLPNRLISNNLQTPGCCQKTSKSYALERRLDGWRKEVGGKLSFYFVSYVCIVYSKYTFLEKKMS